MRRLVRVPLRQMMVQEQTEPDAPPRHRAGEGLCRHGFDVGVGVLHCVDDLGHEGSHSDRMTVCWRTGALAIACSTKAASGRRRAGRRQAEVKIEVRTQVKDEQWTTMIRSMQKNSWTILGSMIV
jgi:hypothetical protein